ncbi:MAG: homoserine O-succinyltransferase [Patescibacteria group bacterium]|jgi:homoserine O-succinyltransferase
MPVNVPDSLPAVGILKKENIFVMEQSRASHQDIRPLRIAIVNIMPLKLVTETQLLRQLSNSPLQVEIDLVHMAEHQSKNTPKEHLDFFYKTFDQIKNQKYDGLIITGAPVEMINFEEVDYWPGITKIMEWSKTNVTSTLHICWSAQAGLYYHYGINKHPLEEKMFGVFWHKVNDSKCLLMRGFDDQFLAPHSRHTGLDRNDIINNKNIKLVAESIEAGPYIIVSRDHKQIFVTGHSEYDALTLKGEYNRDIERGLNINIPNNYFPNDDPTRQPEVLWRSHANLLFSNWLNYYVYQETPFDWS